MKTYAAFLRGVSPMNARMPELKKAFEAAGFTDVRTVLSSGNVIFQARAAGARELEQRAELAMSRRIGRTFPTIVREVEALRVLLASDPWGRFELAAGSKRVVTFLRAVPRSLPALPVAEDGARILCLLGTEALSAYIPGPRGPTFMRLIERTFGEDVTTRTRDTVRKVAT